MGNLIGIACIVAGIYAAVWMLPQMMADDTPDCPSETALVSAEGER